MTTSALITKPSFWQFNLSSAILMTLSAGSLLLVNVQKHIDANMWPTGIATGWPFPIQTGNLDPAYNKAEIAMNFVIGALLVFAVGLASRRLNRHGCHSFTTCVFMIISWMMLWTNTVDVHSKRYYQHLERGWPFMYYMSWTNHEEGIVYGNIFNFILNMLIAGIIVCCVTCGCELLLRISRRAPTG